MWGNASTLFRTVFGHKVVSERLRLTLSQPQFKKGHAMGHPLPRRTFLQVSAASLSTLAIATGAPLARGTQPQTGNHKQKGNKPTNFQIACMTMAYSRFPLQRALAGR